MRDVSKEPYCMSTLVRLPFVREECDTPLSEHVRVSMIQSERCLPWVGSHLIGSGMVMSDGDCCLRSCLFECCY